LPNKMELIKRKEIDMKLAKGVLAGIAIIIIFILLLAAVVSGKYDVEREITIMAPKVKVFDYVKYLKNQDNFSAWAKMDTNMKKEFRGTDGTVGFVSAWESANEEVGKGEQEIIKITDGERIDVELRFIAPFEATDNAYFATSGIDSASTLVKWGFNGEMPYPMNLMLLFMDMDEMLGPDLETGLENLKVILEK